MHADVAGCRIDGADEGDQRDESKMLGARHRRSRRYHQSRACEKKRAQVVTRRQDSNGQCQGCRSEQRRGGNNSDLERAETKQSEIGRQNDGGETVAKSPRGTRGIEIENVGSSPHPHAIKDAETRFQSRHENQSAGVTV